ncbi:MAG TPA: cobaltochelatase subunit CobN, partial [Candidatus Acidoferrum sp.]|nr:cobaltochelatase subunit CobN [Candidatus Acidoferrum sp.]
MMSLPTRRLLLACSGALLLICAAFANAQPVRAPAKQDTITLSYLFSDGNMTGTLEAWRSLLKENPELKDRVQLNFLTESFFDSADPAKLQGSNVMVLDMMNQNMLDRYNKAHDTDLIRDIAAKGKVLAVGVGVQPKEYFTGQGALWDDRAMAYWQNSGRDNQLSLMKLALQKAGVSGLRISDPKPSLDFGYYYPDGNGGRVFADWKSFDDWRRANGKSGSGKPRVAVGFYKSSYYDSETAVIDAVIAEIERQGGEAVPFFGYPDGVAFERMLVDEQGHARADVALSLLMRFADFSVTQHLTKLNIPVINLITLYGRSVQDWQQSPSGLSQFEGTFQAAVPELAGLVAPTVVGSREKRVDAATGLAIVVNQPIPERIAMAVKRGLRYQRLQHKANADRHIAFMYYNYPVGKSNIGASYLNIAESLANILADLKQQGYDVGDKPLDADSILNDITNKARNVGSFAPGELDAMLKQGSVAQVPVSTYRQWLDELDPALRAKLLKDWGDPTNDKLMTTQHDGQTWFVIPRLQYGNILLMPQPIRGWSEDLEKLYHAHDLAPPHQYVAVYRWLHKAEDIDAIVHMGTHGTLEWLDGKDMGLMSADASDALMADIPDLYIYNVDVVGEGLVARRRGMATLIDHMVPP